MSPRERSELYRLGVGAAALAILVATGSRLVVRGEDWLLVAPIALAGILALEFPIHVGLSEKVSVASAVFFAAVLLLPVWQAAALVGAMQATDICIAAVRKVRRSRERPPYRAIAINIFFNGGQAYFSALAAGLLLSAAGVSVRNLAQVTDLLVIVGAAAVMYFGNVFLVAVAIALGTARNPIGLLQSTQKLVYLQFVCLYAVGLFAAFAAVRWPLVPMLAIIPGVLIYHSLKQRIELNHDGMRAMERMADEVDRRDPYTFQHSQRVSIYAHAIARKLGLSPAEIELDSILLKPDQLTHEEKRVMDTHPRLGFDILKPFAAYGKVLELVLSHHERYDGRGYPNGTIGKRLLLIAQVIPVADSLDAMTTARAYRPARSWSTAIDELRRGSGTQWNPSVVEAALTVLSQEDGAPARRPVRASAVAS